MELPCRTTDPELFFAPDATSILTAKALCMKCPIVNACREEGRRLRATGVWGGEDDKDRTKAGRKPVRTRVYAPCGTEAAARRHWRKGEPACQLCLDGAAAAKANRQANQRRSSQSAQVAA
jgi:hypothetical protein